MDIAQECGLATLYDIPHERFGFVDEIVARMPSPDEARKLSVPAGVPVLVYLRTAYTRERPLRLTSTLFAGDRNRIMYELGELEAYHGEQSST